MTFICEPSLNCFICLDSSKCKYLREEIARRQKLLNQELAYMKKLRGRIVVPPYGYKFADEIAADDPSQVRGLLLSFSDDPEFQEAVKKASLKTMIEDLRKNGFLTKWRSQIEH